MITIVSKNIVSEGKVQDFLENAAVLVRESQLEEGCISYHLFQDRENPSILTFIEHWADEKAILQHRESKHFTQIVPVLGKFLDGKDLNVYHKLNIE